MSAERSYCRSCFRDLPSEGTRCFQCFGREDGRPVARIALLLGTAGLPLLIYGLLGFDGRACVAGAVVAGAGILVHVVDSLR
jgi:hypothetical protein